MNNSNLIIKNVIQISETALVVCAKYRNEQSINNLKHCNKQQNKNILV